jgi:hypothetical protein
VAITSKASHLALSLSLSPSPLPPTFLHSLPLTAPPRPPPPLIEKVHSKGGGIKVRFEVLAQHCLVLRMRRIRLECGHVSQVHNKSMGIALRIRAESARSTCLYVSSYHCVCPHTTICPHTTVCPPICVLILLHVSHTTVCVLILLYVSSYHYVICVLIPLYMCPHTE